MNRKELVQRWRNALGYGQKEMFYYPVKKVDNVKYSVTAIVKIPYLTVEDKYDIEKLYIYDRTGTLLGIGNTELPNGTYYAIYKSNSQGGVLLNKKIKFKVKDAPVNFYVLAEREVVKVIFHLTPCEYVLKAYKYSIIHHYETDNRPYTQICRTYDLSNSDFYKDNFPYGIPLDSFDNKTIYYANNPVNWKRYYSATTEFSNLLLDSYPRNNPYITLNSVKEEEKTQGYKISFDIIGENIEYKSTNITIHNNIHRRRSTDGGGTKIQSNKILDEVIWLVEDGWYTRGNLSNLSKYTEQQINNIWTMSFNTAESYNGWGYNRYYQYYSYFLDSRVISTNILNPNVYDQSFNCEEIVYIRQNGKVYYIPFAEYSWTKFWNENETVPPEETSTKNNTTTYNGDRPPYDFSYICTYGEGNYRHEDKKVLSHSDNEITYLCGTHTNVMSPKTSLSDEEVAEMLKSEEYITPIYIENS